MQGVPRGETLVQSVSEWGWGQEERGKEKQGKCSRKPLGGEKTLQGAVGRVRGWKSCHTGGGAQQSLLIENQACGKEARSLGTGRVSGGFVDHGKKYRLFS